MLAVNIYESFDEHWAANRVTGCWDWIRGKNSEGYGQLWFEGKMTKAHRFSYERVNGKILPGMLVRHTCDNTGCVNPLHLLIGTDADNTKDKVERGRLRFPVGERAHFAKITSGDVQRIRDISRVGNVSQKEIAIYFAIDQTNVSLIANKKSWKHVT